jgi:hypothetical protein
MPSQSEQWWAFLGLCPYFSGTPVSSRLLKRQRQFIEHSANAVVDRETLLLNSGLAFFRDDLEADLALMELTRDGMLIPISETPFLFAIDRFRTIGADTCGSSLSKPGRKVWLIIVDGCEVATQVPKSRPAANAICIAQRLFPEAVIDSPTEPALLFTSRTVLSPDSELGGANLV